MLPGTGFPNSLSPSTVQSGQPLSVLRGRSPGLAYNADPLAGISHGAWPQQQGQANTPGLAESSKGNGISGSNGHHRLPGCYKGMAPVSPCCSCPDHAAQMQVWPSSAARLSEDIAPAGSCCFCHPDHATYVNLAFSLVVCLLAEVFVEASVPNSPGLGVLRLNHCQPFS